MHSVLKLCELLRTGKTTPTELTRQCLDRIAEIDPKLNAFITVTDDLAMAQAREAERELASGVDHGVLHGIPVALKDLIDVEGVRTTAASRVLEDNVATADAEVTRRLRDAGAIFLGKTNLHEFAYGGSGMISAYGVARNPWDTERICGGSSSGSAAAVAAGMVPLAIGTDTAGSIRLPASFCGIVGLKPTHGLVSAEGVVTLAESLDHVGPLARTVEDIMLALEVLADVPESTFPDAPRIGVARKFFLVQADAAVVAVFDAAINLLSSVFGDAREIEVPVDNDRTLQKGESWHYHRRFADREHLYDPQTLARIRTGADVSAADVARLRTELQHFRRASTSTFDNVDFVATLTVPIEPPRLADLEGPNLREAELLMLRNTRPFNVLGWPTITIPCGLTTRGLPVGLQLSAAPYKERALLEFALMCQVALATGTNG